MNFLKKRQTAPTTPAKELVKQPTVIIPLTDYQWAVNTAIDRLGTSATVAALAETARQLLVWEYQNSNIDTTQINNLLIAPRQPFI